MGVGCTVGAESGCDVGGAFEEVDEAECAGIVDSERGGETEDTDGWTGRR